MFHGVVESCNNADFQGGLMKIALGLLLAVSVLAAQTATDTPEAHVAAAKTAAGADYQNLFNFLCAVPGPRGGGRGAGAGAPRGQGGGQRQQGPPDRSTWYAEPAKVFDNLYFVGQSEYSVWAITSSEGIIVIDTIFDYSVEEEVAGGLKKLGLDPANIKYAVVTHPHPDHHGGAKFLQDRYGVRVIMSAADWDFLDKTGGTKPKRDLVATDGQKLTLGDATVTLYITPGHTPGTISALIPVKDNGKPHLAALWGGTGLNADRESIQSYIKSAQRFTEVARQAGADILLSNHTDWDGAKVHLPRMAKRTPGSAHPFVVGNESVRRYLKVAEECATSRLLRLN
jgi:metallo-beta-lactamase class B